MAESKRGGWVILVVVVVIVVVAAVYLFARWDQGHAARTAEQQDPPKPIESSPQTEEDAKEGEPIGQEGGS